MRIQYRLESLSLKIVHETELQGQDHKRGTELTISQNQKVGIKLTEDGK